MAGVPPPPPPPPGQRGPPPPGFRPQGGPGPQGMPMQIPMRQAPIQNGARISNITSPRVMEELDALKLLTTYKVFTMRKLVPENPRHKSSWAVAEIYEERLAQPEIIKLIKRLNESKRTVSDKKAALQPYQTTQVNNVMDDLVATDQDPANFEWALVQLDSVQKALPTSDRGKKRYRETVTITVYAKRSPHPDRNPAALLHQLERLRAEQERDQREHERMMQEAMRPRPPPPQPLPLPPQPMPPPPPPQQLPHPGPSPRPPMGPQPNERPGPHAGARPGGHSNVINMGKTGTGNGRPKLARGKHGSSKKNRHHESDISSDISSETSFISETDESDAKSYDSSKSSISSVDDRRERRHHSVHRGPIRSRSRHRPEVKTIYLEGRSPSPSRRFRESLQLGEYSALPQRAYAPEVPRMGPEADAISSAYRAGREVGIAERREQPPVIIERIIEKPVISYGRPEPRFQEPRRLEPRRFIEEREQYIDDVHLDEDRDYIRHQQEAEEYIRRKIMVEPREEYQRRLDPPQFARRQSSPVRLERLDRFNRRQRSPGEEAFGRRSSLSSPTRTRLSNQNPFSPVFSPTLLSRRYPEATGSYDGGW